MMTPDEIEQMKAELEAEVLRLRRVMFEAHQLGEAGMLDEMLATLDGEFLDGGTDD